MFKLLNAGYNRLIKSKIFWLLIIFTIGLAFFVIYAQYNQMIKYDYIVQIEQLILNYGTFIGVVIAIFTSLFLGVEYSDGAIRNKISIGHKRINIYLSNLWIIITTSLFSYFLFTAIILVIGLPIFGPISLKITSFLSLLGCIFLNVLVFSSIATFIAMSISNKTIAAITSIMLTFGLMMTALTCLNVLDTPKMIQEASIVDGETKIEAAPNPKYPSEEKKKAMQTLLNINPAGQMFQIVGRRTTDIKILPIYSSVNTILFVTVGLILFNKKELK